jgi:branched-chain amino acid transport system permease protein
MTAAGTRNAGGVRPATVALLLVLALMASLPAWGARRELHLCAEFCCYLALAQLWNLLAGYAGLVSIGQQAFVGVGAYALFLGCVLSPMPPLLGLPLAALAAALVALPAAWLLFRLRGAYFAIGSWAVAETLRLAASQLTVLGGGSGKSLPIGVVHAIASTRGVRDALLFWLSLATVVAVMAGILWLLRSRTGLALTALRDNPATAASIGIPAGRLKLAVFAGAAAATGLVGALLFLNRLRVAPDAAFDLDWTTNAMFIVVIGGLGSLEGPVLGALFFFACRELFSQHGAAYMVAMGAIAIAMMLWAPAGLWGLLRGRRGTTLFDTRRRP